MKLNYKIEENDFLQFQLHACSKSKSIQKKKVKGLVLSAIIFSFSSIYFYYKGMLSTAIFSGIFVLITILFYPKYFKWHYKRHYEKYLKEHYVKRFGKVVELEFTESHILSKDSVSENKMQLSEIEQITELPEHFLIALSNGMTLILPKRGLGSTQNLKTKFQELGLTIVDELNWKW